MRQRYQNHQYPAYLPSLSYTVSQLPYGHEPSRRDSLTSHSGSPLHTIRQSTSFLPSFHDHGVSLQRYRYPAQHLPDDIFPRDISLPPMCRVEPSSNSAVYINPNISGVRGRRSRELGRAKYLTSADHHHHPPHHLSTTTTTTMAVLDLEEQLVFVRLPSHPALLLRLTR